MALLGTDFAIDPATGDLDMSGGDAKQTVDIAQAISWKLCLVLGEWFLDLDDGIPYFEEFFVKAPVIEHLETILKDAVLSFDEVESVADMNIDYNENTRKLTVVWAAESTTGLLTGTEEL